MHVALAVHYPKGPNEHAVMMEEMKRFAEVESRHRGFVQLFVAEVPDKGFLIPFTVWETEEAYRAAWPEIAKYLATFDFATNQEGPTRAGGAAPSPGSRLTTFAVLPVVRPSSTPSRE